MRAAAVLYDLDGTLLSTAGSGRRAMDQALRELGLADGLGAMRLDGMTDRAIVREAVLAHRLPCDELHIDRAIGRYLELLSENIEACAEYVVLPGVARSIQALRAIGAAVGLGTGNVERGARIKLERSGLNSQLPFGGFGSDHEDRAELLRAGVGRAEASVGRTLSGEEIWIIGDTPKDVAAGKKIGACVLAVATGRYSVEELRACGADVSVPDLAHPDALVRMLG
jgi:phosphoglycolate phosphatase